MERGPFEGSSARADVVRNLFNLWEGALLFSSPPGFCETTVTAAMYRIFVLATGVHLYSVKLRYVPWMQTVQLSNCNNDGRRERRTLVTILPLPILLNNPSKK